MGLAFVFNLTSPDIHVR